MVLLQEDTDIGYFYNAAEEEENSKDEGKEKDMDEIFMLHFQDIEWTYAWVVTGVFFHLQPEGYTVIHTPVLPPPEGLI